jgi:MFS family permease
MSMRSDPAFPIFRNHPLPALAVICLGVFVISVDATIVNVALPTLSRELGADTAQLQWIVDAYTLVMSAASATAMAGVAGSARVSRCLRSPQALRHR